MKTYNLIFTIDRTQREGAWMTAHELAAALKYHLENRYGFQQVIDVQPMEEKLKEGG